MNSPIDKAALAAHFAAQNQGGQQHEAPSPVPLRQEQYGALTPAQRAHQELVNMQQMMQSCQL